MKRLIIEKEKLIENINNIKSYINVPIIGVVKGDGYGLDLIPYSTILKENGIDFFAVSESIEALKLKENDFSNVLLMSPEHDHNVLKELIENEVILTVGSSEMLDLICLLSNGKNTKIHIKVDTGFGRFGFSYKNIDEIASIFECENIIIDGIFSHFSCSFEKKYNITKLQNDRFTFVLNELSNRGLNTNISHIANSCGALNFPDTHHNAVRIGSAFLGRLPISSPIKLNKIGYLKTKVIDTNTVLKGENIGYGNVYKTKTDIQTATIAIGYKDGFGVAKSNDTFRFIDILRYIWGNLKSYNKLQYLYKNENQILGRVGMYSTTILNKNNLKPNDVAFVDINPLFIDSSINREYL
jgi:alanine racemase